MMHLTDQQIETLHRKYARSEADFELIYRHSIVVEAIAMQLLDYKPIVGINRQLVHMGAMLHDIGAYQVLEDSKFVQGVRHGVFGEKILKDEGFPEQVWRVASHHTGVGLTQQDVVEQNLPIPMADYMPVTNEEWLITYADNFHSKSKPPTEPPYFCSYESCRKSLLKFGADKAATLDNLARQFGKPELDELQKRFDYEIK